MPPEAATQRATAAIAGLAGLGTFATKRSRVVGMMGEVEAPVVARPLPAIQASIQPPGPANPNHICRPLCPPSSRPSLTPLTEPK